MPKEDWGVKRVCPTTGKRFYDLNKNPIVSPYTGDVVVLDTGKGSRTLVADKADKSATKKDVTDDAEEVVLDDDDDLDIDADADVDLDDGDDDDDVLDDDDDTETVALDDLKDVAANDGDDD
ncbi:TIGR02300 family protein [Rhodophyticola sp. CCM32]|uniref:TIGR02300 family protein n=1 Tax=Rhodophyticola sp. CCM32 TaxID=2916397 RepID=UPI00107F0FBA|nr:TIGR02300 family protein [Rhodophyticola sp. CCM32]QBX99657.1 TIGR02300 family protein [Rhodophyticola sp. CCM32]